MMDRRPLLLALLLITVACVGIYAAPPSDAAVTRIESSSATVVSGSWTTESNVSHSAGSARYSATSGATLQFAFTVSAGNTATAQLIERRFSNHCATAEWRVDGGAWTVFNASTPAGYQVAGPITGTLAAGAHTFDVKNACTSGSAYLNVDALDVDETPVPTTTTTTAAPTTTTTATPTTTTTVAESGTGSACDWERAGIPEETPEPCNDGATLDALGADTGVVVLGFGGLALGLAIARIVKPTEEWLQ